MRPYRLLRAPQGHFEVPAAQATAELGRLRARSGAGPACGAQHPRYAGQPDAEMLDDAIRGLGTYHTHPIALRAGAADGLIQVKDVKLLYYYQNRTAHIPPEAP